jgi:hypothetical protein
MTTKAQQPTTLEEALRLLQEERESRQASEKVNVRNLYRLQTKYDAVVRSLEECKNEMSARRTRSEVMAKENQELESYSIELKRTSEGQKLKSEIEEKERLTTISSLASECQRLKSTLIKEEKAKQELEERLLLFELRIIQQREDNDSLIERLQDKWRKEKEDYESKIHSMGEDRMNLQNQNNIIEQELLARKATTTRQPPSLAAQPSSPSFTSPCPSSSPSVTSLLTSSPPFLLPISSSVSGQPLTVGEPPSSSTSGLPSTEHVSNE